MGMIGAWESCRKRREKCDPRIPCKSCVLFYKVGFRLHTCTRTNVVKKAKAVAVASMDDSNQSGISGDVRKGEEHRKETEAVEHNTDIVISAREP